MAFEKLTNNLKGLTDNTQQYAKTTAEYYKLRLFKNGMKGLIGVANLTLRATFGLLFLLFVSIGLAIYIGEQMESASAGYFIVGGFYFLIFLLIFAFAAKPIEKMLLEKYSKMAFKNNSTIEEDAIVAASQATPASPVTHAVPDESI